LIAYPLMLVFWPWAQSDPISHPLQALAVFSKEIFWAKVLFDGQLIAANQLPWDYLPVSIGIVLPELVLALLLAAPILALVALARRNAWRYERVLSLFMVGFTIVFPVVYAIATKAVLFNGMRHFLFVLPPIAVVAGLVGDRALDRLAAFEYRAPIYAALGLYGVVHLSIMAMLHPDQYVYYNAFVGGCRVRRTSSSSTIGPIPSRRRCVGWKTACARSTARVSPTTNSPLRSRDRSFRRGTTSRRISGR
jgi:hypothetical protein